MTIFPGDKRIVMYVIRLKNCCFFANHGVFDEEKTLGQRFHVDAEIHVDALPALDTDDVGETVDYGLVFVEIERILSGPRRFLIEALAQASDKPLLGLDETHMPPEMAAYLSILRAGNVHVLRDGRWQIVRPDPDPLNLAPAL
ncbi:dihydroneopterin aldolase, partial [Staphylococcus aureus]|nr:dihydroneopterin aldolase [Staphylococcus aureus]